MSRDRHVVLVGLMASGKTTVGTRLADRLGLPFVDNDTLLTRRKGRSARDIEVSEGLEALHRDEAEVLRSALAAPAPAVVAAAAGAVLEPDVAAALAGEDVVYLRVLPDVIQGRLASGHDDGHRPLLDIGALFAARDEIYHRLATVVVDAAPDPDAVVDEIIQRLARRSLGR